MRKLKPGMLVVDNIDGEMIIVTTVCTIPRTTVVEFMGIIVRCRNTKPGQSVIRWLDSHWEVVSDGPGR